MGGVIVLYGDKGYMFHKGSKVAKKIDIWIQKELRDSQDYGCTVAYKENNVYNLYMKLAFCFASFFFFLFFSPSCFTFHCFPFLVFSSTLFFVFSTRFSFSPPLLFPFFSLSLTLPPFLPSLLPSRLLTPFPPFLPLFVHWFFPCFSFCFPCVPFVFPCCCCFSPFVFPFFSFFSPFHPFVFFFFLVFILFHPLFVSFFAFFPFFVRGLVFFFGWGEGCVFFCLFFFVFSPVGKAESPAM